MLKSLISVCVGVTLTIGLTGCGANIPKPYRTKIKDFTNVTSNEKNNILSKCMTKIPKFDSDPNRLNSTLGTLGIGEYFSSVNGNIIEYNGYGAVFAHQFLLDNRTNELYRKDVSKSRYHDKGETVYGAGTDDEGFSSYINNFQVQLSEEYSYYLKKYSKFKISYTENNQKIDLKLKQIKTSFVDTTNILSNDILQQFSKNKVTLNVQPLMEAFTNIYFPNKYISYKPYCTISNSIIYENINRYTVEYEKKKILKSCKKFPVNTIFKIDKVYFNYLPNKYFASDKNINIEITNNPTGSNSIETIKITNKTKNFLEINAIAGYYGTNVTDNIIKNMKKIKIPPMSFKIFKTGNSYKYSINDYPLKKSLEVKNKNQKIYYGFSVAYKIINQNIVKNIYRVNKYTIEDYN